VTLIPKIDCPLGLKDYRPITLVGCLYKIVAKILVERLKKMLKGVISRAQTAFLAGISIIDGAIALNETIDDAKREKWLHCFQGRFSQGL
jgi:hypothetical protein